MNTVILRAVRTLIIVERRSKFIKSRNLSSDLYEPEYLQGLKPLIPLHDTLNIQIRGYDYPILESYQKLIHNLAKNMDINVEDAWACPAQNLKISTFKPKSETINAQFNLNVYERTVQITDVSSLQLTILLRALEASTPAGVTVHVVSHEQYHEDIRYVPDSELRSLKKELDDLGGPIKKK